MSSSASPPPRRSSRPTGRALGRRGAAGVAVLALACAGLTGTVVLAPAAQAAGEAVKVNQVAYVPGIAKKATYVSSSSSPLTWTLRNSGGAAVATGSTSVLGFDSLSGDRAHIIDFSSYDTTGTGYTISVGSDVSYPFDISGAPYQQLRKDAMAFFYHQRSGIAIESQYVGSTYARPAGHVNVSPNQGDNNVTCRSSSVCSYRLDGRGGWYDAGDHGKYVVNGGISVWQLLDIYERSQKMPGAAATSLGDGSLAIPERANGVPDILDEARWELDWILRMQAPSGSANAGLVHHKLADDAWTGIPQRPETDSQPRHLSAVSTAATLNAAAVFAKASRLWSGIDASYSATLLSAAERAYSAAKANPSKFTSSADDTGSGSYGDSTLSDEFYWAAAELFITTGKSAYQSDVTSSGHYRGASITTGGFWWGGVAALGDISLSYVPNGLSSSDVAVIRSKITSVSDSLLSLIASQAYPAPIQPVSGKYDWGSNSAAANNAVILALAYDFTGQAKYKNGVFAAYDYLFGRNPLSQSYVTGYGEKPVRNVHHRFWANQNDASYPIAPPGVLSGGPNSYLHDDIAAARLQGCAAQRCFLDDIGAYSLNEVTVNWNSALAWVADWAAEKATGTPITTTTTTTSSRPTTTTTTTRPTTTTTTSSQPTTTTTTTSGAPVPSVTWTVDGSWSGGLQAVLKVTNTGPNTINGWTVGATLPPGQTIQQVYNGSFTQSGQQVTITNAPYNGTITPGQTVSTGIAISWTTSNAPAINLTLNGASDNPTSTTTTTSSRPTTTTTTTTRPTTTTTTTRTTTTTTTTTRPTTTTTTTTTTTGGGGKSCSAVITVTGSWGSGWQGDVTVTAGSAAISHWTLSWTFANGALSSGWNATLSGTSSVTASDLGWNGNLGAGASTSWGFIASGTPSTPTVTCTAS